MPEPEEYDDEELFPRQFLRQSLPTLLIVPTAVLIWAVVIGLILFRSMHPWWYSLLWTGLFGALTVLIHAVLRRRERVVRISAAVAALCALLFIVTTGWRYLTVTRFRQVCDDIYWYNYRPFKPNSRVVKVVAPPELRISDNPPRVSAAHLMYPLCAGAAQALYPPRDSGYDELTAHSAESIYQMLLNGEVDAIIGPPPTAAQLEAAKTRNFAYEITPFARDAFVFFVNRRNPIPGLSTDQIRGIYSGRITRWEDVGAGTGEIKPFQHGKGNCSQTLMESVMADTPLMAPLRENRRSGMIGTVSDVADYRNYRGALGYSFRFFVSGVSRNSDIKMLAVDGVRPTADNIRSGSYPFVTDCCVVTVQPRDANIRKIVDFLRSPAGSELIEKAGYVPLAAPDQTAR